MSTTAGWGTDCCEASPSLPAWFGALSTPSRRATVDPALKRRLLESIGVAPVERRPGSGRVALALAVVALVVAAGALLLLERQCRVGRQGHSGRLTAAMIWSIISKSPRSVISRDVAGWRVARNPSAKRRGFHFGTRIFAVVQCSMTSFRSVQSEDDDRPARS
jgi:hypothetical protein